jgi:glycosyltransferase involved in cell wall biosynthesis
MLSVDVIVPAFNEERTIVEVLERISRVKTPGVSYQVTVVDDGSTDRTATVVEARTDLYGRFIRLAANGGKGAAVRAALKTATSDYVLFQDADLEYDPSDYEKLLLPALRFEADVVIGSRFMAPQYTRVYYYWHSIGNRLITSFFNVLNNTTFTDIYSCYLLYRRDLVNPDELQSDGWDQHAEILSRAVARGRIFYEVPISYHGRTYEEGKKIRAQHALSVLSRIARQRLLDHPAKIARRIGATVP